MLSSRISLNDAIRIVTPLNYLCPYQPAQEKLRARQEAQKIKASLETHSPLNRFGSLLALFCTTELYISRLNSKKFIWGAYKRTLKKDRPYKAIVSREDLDNFEYEWVGQDAFNQDKQEFQDFLLECQGENYGSNLIYSALPVVAIILLMAVSLKLSVLVTLASALIWTTYKVIYVLLPETLRTKLDGSPVGLLSRSPGALRWATLLKNIRPFFTIGMYAIPPIALTMIVGHWISQTTGLEKLLEARKLKAKTGLVLRQNIAVKDTHEYGFIYSRAFAVTLMAIFLSGLPAFLSYYLYCTAGVDAIFGYPSRDPQFLKIMFINLYLGSVGACLSVLFFRAWFSFPLNFLSAEYDIDLSESKIEKQSAKGWFSVCLFWGWQSDLFSSELKWKDVRQVEFTSGNNFRLYPLPPVFFKEQSRVYKILNRLAALFDAVSKHQAKDHRLRIYGKHSEIMELRLDELDREQKTKVFSYIRKYAPQALVSEEAQQALVGSTILRDPKHTELWFDLLLDQAKRAHSAIKSSNLSLRNGKYTISRKLASGGQASVYLAYDKNDQPFILKEFVLPEGKVESQLESMVEFENESLILSRLEHPQIVRLKDQFIENCRAYLVIEYVEGKTLRDIVSDNGAMAETEVVGLAEQMVEILSYLEKQNPPVVHRDFTPDNLILQQDGKLKLIDFSISHLFKAGESGDCAGKHSYTPPEQYRGEATTQSDIYAFGATLAFLLTGKDPQPIAASLVKDSHPEISQAISNLVARATAIPLCERYENSKWIELDLAAARATFESRHQRPLPEKRSESYDSNTGSN